MTDGLLRRKPGLRPTGDSIRDILGLEEDTRSTSYSRESRGSKGSVDGDDSELKEFDKEALVLIGRDKQLAQLEAIRREFLKTRQCSVVWVIGKSGEGKSTLVETFLQPLRKGNDMLVLSGRCYDRESVPYKALDVLIEALVNFLRSRPQAQLNACLPRDIVLLARLFPALRRVDAIDNLPAVPVAGMDERQIRLRALFALRELLVSIGRSMPIIVFVDDLQWGDADSAEALAELIAPPEPPSIMVLGSYRSDEAERSPFLCEWKCLSKQRDDCLSARLVQVTPLTEEQCLEFLAQRAGMPIETLRGQTANMLADSKGNAYLLEQLAEGFNTETGKFEPVPLCDILERKLRQLPTDARDLLTVIAISGQAVSLKEASVVAGHKHPLLSTVTHMRSEKLVRLIGSDEQQLVDTYHDKIRETLLDSLSNKDRCVWHLRFAEMLEKQEKIDANELLSKLGQKPGSDLRDVCGVNRVYDLAYHFHAANDPRSFTYQLLAGEQALRTYALEESIFFFERAQKLCPPDASDTVQHRLYLSVGRVMLWNNMPELSIKAYKKAEELADGSLSRARALVGLGTVCNQIGQFDASIEHCDSALRALGTPRSKTLVGNTFQLMKALLSLFLLPPKLLHIKDDLGQERALLQHEIFLRLASFLPEKNFVSSAEVFLRDSIATLQTGKAHLHAQGYASAAFLFSGYGAPWLGNLLLRWSSRIESKLNDPSTRGMFLYSAGVASYWGGDLKAAEASLGAAVPLLERSGNTYSQMVSIHMLRHTQSFKGSASAEESVARRVLELGRATGNVQCTCWGAYDVANALARRGEFSEAFDHMQQSFRALTNERFNMTEAIRASTFGYVLLQASQYDAARESAQKGWSLVSKCPIDVTMLSCPVLIESMAGPMWTAPLTPPESQVLRRLLRWAFMVHLSYPNHQPHLQRVQGRAVWSLGKKHQAIRKFERAVELARKKGMDYQRARSLLDLAAVKDEERQKNRAEAIKLLKTMESVIPRAESWLLGDQYDESVVAPKFDLEAWECKHGTISPRIDVDLG